MPTVLVSSLLSSACVAALRAMGAEVLLMPPCPRLPAPLSSHPDLLGAVLPSGTLLLEAAYYEDNRPFFDGLGCPIRRTGETLSSVYPGDVLLDALAVGDTLYGKAEAVSDALVAAYPRFRSVRQGYARCSVALLSDRAAITADRELARMMAEDGIDVLMVRPGHIDLPGYDCGFLGGAGGRLTTDTYVFFGRIEDHPDGEAILAFAEGQKISAVSLSDEPIKDHGGMLVI